ncbi:hypothetical protein [Flexibacterium corallicola]|uniref:hypothetical protein n=1 Tax=Flexibacterium corallicola TaxID=3037259 RepID=UPI00286F621D|nr:hypothetical protein [Pseudovibrio sp. M1P-2-3]
MLRLFQKARTRVKTSLSYLLLGQKRRDYGKRLSKHATVHKGERQPVGTMSANVGGRHIPERPRQVQEDLSGELELKGFLDTFQAHPLHLVQGQNDKEHS